MLTSTLSPSFLVTYSLYTSSVWCKALCIIIIFVEALPPVISFIFSVVVMMKPYYFQYWHILFLLLSWRIFCPYHLSGVRHYAPLLAFLFSCSFIDILPNLFHLVFQSLYYWIDVIFNVSMPLFFPWHI